MMGTNYILMRLALGSSVLVFSASLVSINGLAAPWAQQKEKLAGRVETMRQRDPVFVKTYSYDRQGNLRELIIDTVEKRHGWPSREVYQYSQMGKLIMIVKFVKDGSPYARTAVGRDAQGRETLNVRALADGSFEEAKFYRYDIQGKLTEQFIFSTGPTGPSLLEKLSYTYDDQGRLVKEDTYQHEIRYAYDQGGRLQKEEWYRKTFNRVSRVTVYEDKGNPSEFREYTDEGVLGRVTFYRYEYDSVGNWTKQAAAVHSSIDGKLVLQQTDITQRSITYYSDGSN